MAITGVAAEEAEEAEEATEEWGGANTAGRAEVNAVA